MPAPTPRTGQDRYMRGLRAAEEKGRAAGRNPTTTEQDCPYTRFEHKHWWTEGFRDARKETTP